jgi:signal transduction histidine kinase
MNSFRNVERYPRPLLVAVSFGLLIVVGVVDYLTGFNLSFSAFYLLAIGFAVWFVGRRFGLAMSVLSIVSWLAGDYTAGARFPNLFIPAWNAAILLAFYGVVVWLLDRLRSLNRELENRVQQRTLALTREIAGRERLEKELLDISEREQRRIGHDLHDNFCQHLTSTAMAAQVLREKLNANAAPESEDAAKIVALAEEGIAMARELARGLSPVELEAEGLMAALQELAAGISKWSKVGCVFECESPVLVHRATVAENFYRIAQEAVSNAIRHGKAQHIIIGLHEHTAGITLSIEDDGTGLPDDWKDGSGLGTRIMAHRAAIIGGALSVEPNPTGGTLVVCNLPAAAKS